MTRYARTERAAFADALRAAGPDAPTLCGDWTARDLAAHVVLRERDPLAAAGILVKPLAGWTARRQRGIAAREFDALVSQLGDPPAWSPLSNPVLDESYNVLEMYVHHEDLRRAQPGWQPRRLDPDYEKALWGKVKGAARLALRRFPATVVVDWPGHDRVSVGAGGPEVTVRGEPGELIMFVTGRQRVADVAVSGPEAQVERLRQARLGI